MAKTSLSFTERGVKNFRQKSIWYLFGAALVLLSINFFLQFVFKTDNSEGEYNVIQKDIHDRFLLTLKSFGLEDDWIKQKIVTNKKSSESNFSYKVSVPAGLSVPEILLDVFNEFRNDSLVIESFEKTAGSRSIFTLKKNEKNLLSAEFIYNSRLSRERGSLAFILQGVDLNNVDDSILVESPAKFNLLLNPGAANLAKLDFIKLEHKSYSVLINDHIADADYRLKPSYPKLRILNAVKALSTDYARADFFVVDDNSDFYKSDIYDFFKKELEKRKIKLYRLSDFSTLGAEEELHTGFNNHIKNLKENEVEIFLFDKDDYLLLKPEIAAYMKLGVKVLNTSEIDN